MNDLFNCTSNLNEYECKKCKSNFKTRVEHHNHLQKYREHKANTGLSDIKKDPNTILNKPQLFKCSNCNYFSRNKTAVERHILFNHNNNKNYFKIPSWQKPNTDDLGVLECTQCDYFGFSQSHLRRHIWSKHNVNNNNKINSVKCEQCNFETNKSCLLKRHIQRKHFDYSTKIKTDQKLHISHKHRPKEKKEKIEWLKCEECDYKTKAVYNFKSHVQRKHSKFIEGEIFKCFHCDYSNRLKDNLRKHIVYNHTPDDRIKWWKCEQCDFKTKACITLALHYQSKHPDYDYSKLGKNPPKSEILDKSTTIEGNVICEQSDSFMKIKGDSKKDGLNKHTPENRTNWLKCDQCDYSTQTKRYLRRHILYKHSPDDRVKWWKCEQCDFKTKIKSNLKRHILIKHSSNIDNLKK